MTIKEINICTTLHSYLTMTIKEMFMYLSFAWSPAHPWGNGSAAAVSDATGRNAAFTLLSSSEEEEEEEEFSLIAAEP